MADRIPVWGDPSTNPGKVREFETGDNMVLPGGLKLRGGSVSVDPSVTPQPGSVPVSRPDGSLDPRWMPELVAGMNARALAQAVHLTPAASGSSGIRVADNPENNFGTGDFTLSFRMARPTWEDVERVISKSGAFEIYASGSGVPRLSIGGTVFTLSTEMDLGARIMAEHTIAVSRESPSQDGLASWYVDGTLWATVTIPAQETIDASSANPLYICGNSSQRRDGLTQTFRLYNYALTPEQVLDHYRNGVPQSDRGGSQVPIYESDFSSGTDGFGNRSNCIVTGGHDGIGGLDGWLKITTTSAFSCNFNHSALLVPGNKSQRLRFQYFIPSSNATVDRLQMRRGSTEIHHSIGAALAADTVHEFDSAALGAGNLAELRFYVGSPAGSTTSGTVGDVIYMRAFQYDQLGCTLDLDPESITHTQWLDSSGHGNHALLPESGATLVRPQYEGDIRWRHEWKGTQEIQYTGGVNQAIIPASAALRGYIDIIASDPVTIDIGDGADQDRYAAAELVAGRSRVELLTPFHDGTNRKLTVKPTTDFDGTLSITAPYEILEDIA